MNRPTRAEIDLSAIAFNMAQVRWIVGPEVKICPAVKADGYGHGAIEVSRTVLEAGADMLGVATLEEALELRQAGIHAPILIFQCTTSEQIPLIVEHDITPMVCDCGFAEKLSRQALQQGKKVKVHMKVDTGMGRVGVHCGSAVDFAVTISEMPGIELEGFFTHFASADEEDMAFTYEQIAQFDQVTNAIRQAGVHIPIRHAANSAAVLNVPESYYDMVRPGIMLYGLYDSHFVSRIPELRQALTLKTGIVFLKELPAGSTVSYGRTYTTSRKSLVATLPIGYADGYNRRLSNQAHAVVRGVRVPVIGRVCMDQTIIDVTDVPGIALGDEVLLYGGSASDGEIAMEEIESILGTISYEIVCSISKRVPRIYLREDG